LTTHLEPAIGPPLIGALLRMPVDAIRARMLAGLHEAGFTDLVPAHLAVLRYPGPEDQRPSHVAAQAGMTKQAMNYLLGQLQQLGYLTREDDPDDQRSKRIRLTDRGHAAARCIRRTVAGIETELAEELGSKHFAQLRELLAQLNATNAITEHRP
jgi:DNA-binding MarR family transcriptional regulator